METSKGQKRFIIVDAITILFILLVLIYVALTSVMWKEANPLDTLFSEEFCDGWVDCSTNKPIDITLPYTTAPNDRGMVAIEHALPDDLEDNTYISFRAKRQNITVFIDGVERTRFVQNERYVKFGRPVSRYIYVKLYREDAGKTIRIEGIREGTSNRDMTKAYIGDKAGIMATYLRKQMLAIIFSIAFAIVGFFTILVGFAFRIATKNGARIDYIGWSMLLIAIWDITQSDFRDFFFSNISMVSLAAALALLVIPIPLALYFDWVQGGRYRKYYYMYALFVTIDVLVVVFLKLKGIMTFSQTLIPAFVFLFGLFFVFVFFVICDKKAGDKHKEYAVVTASTILLVIFGVMQTYRFYAPSDGESGTFLCLGFLCMTIASLIYAILIILKMNAEKHAAIMTADMKTQFLATMSHEIRTPINAVLGMNEAIARESSEDNIIGYANDVDTAGKLLLSLVNDILDFTKLEAGKMTLVDETYKLKKLLSFAYGMVVNKAKEKGLQIKVTADEKLPAKLFGDEVRLQQIFINILNNAVKYTDKGTVELNVSFDKIDEENINLIVKIKDTGRGIKKEDLKNLFSEFSRVDEKRNRQIEGTGLGLAIASKFTKLMGGSILVDSEYGVGTEFTILVPQKVVDWEPLGNVSIENYGFSDITAREELFKAPGKRILVVDDVHLNLKVVNSLLKTTEMKIDNALSGEIGLKMASEMKYDIIFLDHMMPEKDGIETLKELKQDRGGINYDTPVVMMTANAMRGAKDEYIELGFSDYISKPFNVSDLKRVILQYIDI